MENELIQQEDIKPLIIESGNQWDIPSETPQNLNDQEGATKLNPNFSKIVPINSRGEITSETSDDCSQAPLKKRRYEPTTENTYTNGCALINSYSPLSQHMPQSNEIIKNNFNCRFCSFNTNSEATFTMHLLEHVNGQSKTEDKVHDKNMNNSENSCYTSTNSESPNNSISITITAPKNHGGNAKDIKRSIVDEILKKLGFTSDGTEVEDNINIANKNAEANVEMRNLTEERNCNFNKITLETHKNNGVTKTNPSLKTYTRKSPNKTTPTQPPCYDSFIGATVDSNIDNEPIADANQLLITQPITEQLNDMESSYHILKNVIHAQIDGSDETGYQFVPNNVKQIIDIKTEHSLFSIETAHTEDDLISMTPVEPTPAKNSIRILSNVSITRPHENDMLFNEEDSYSHHQPLSDEEDEGYRCYHNKVLIPPDENFGKIHNFQCQYCPTKTAPAEKHFRAHYRMHFTKKGIQCPFCTYRSTKSNVVNHLFCHLPRKGAICPLCHVRKSTRETVIDHLKIVHSKQLFEKHDLVCKSWYCGK